MKSGKIPLNANGDFRKSPKPVRKVLENERQPKHTSPKHEPKKPAGGKRAAWSKLATLDDEVDGYVCLGAVGAATFAFC